MYRLSLQIRLVQRALASDTLQSHFLHNGQMFQMSVPKYAWALATLHCAVYANFCTGDNVGIHCIFLYMMQSFIFHRRSVPAVL